MKVYILDSKKITKYNLPIKVEEDYLINYIGESGKESVITVAAKNGNWYLKNDGSADMIGESSDEIVLQNYNMHFLKLTGNENIILYAMPDQENELYSLDITNSTSLSIGNDSTCNVYYHNNVIPAKLCEVELKDNNWYLKVLTNTVVYVNDRIVSSQVLKCGDIIFIYGLKIIWMKDYIKVNNPGHLVNINGLQAYSKDLVENNVCSPIPENEKAVELYTEEQYFYHIPNIREVIKDETLVIDQPPQNQQKEEIPFWLSIGSSLVMMSSTIVMGFSIYSNVIGGNAKWYTILPQAIMICAMIIGCLVFPKLLSNYQKKREKKREQLRQDKYKQYLFDKQKQINDINVRQHDILLDNNNNALECYNTIMNKGRKLWVRQITDDDFLNVRLGIGTVDSKLKVSAPEEHFSLDIDNLFDLACDINTKSKKIDNCPIVYSLVDNFNISMVFNCSYKYNYIENMIVQILSYQSSVDLKIVVATNERNAYHWDYMKNLPYCWDNMYSIRYYSTNESEFETISNSLDAELKSRRAVMKGKNPDKNEDEEVDTTDAHKNFSTYFLIITDDYSTIKNSQFIVDLSKFKNNLGFTLITVTDTIKNSPNNCDKFIEIGEKDSCVLSKDLSYQTQTPFFNEKPVLINMYDISNKLSNIPVMPQDGLNALPESLTFLEMFDVSKIEQLNILNRWQTNNPVNSLAATIGVHANLEPFKLDLHEKYHGPHGLIAGSTGSGKSEFIITYILSMALNYHPYEVQFVLIDYKGGGLAGAFENRETGVRLPHLIGTITNLDTSEMNRTLVSIKSELTRRQKVFNKVRDSLGESTIDIYKYQKLYRDGTVKEPMAHLFIISDEFAELKSQQPDFMSELISTARIGRSLGVHLILATQKPSGVVNDQIWSNSKFKVCLKVQDRGDSMEILKKPDAASIKEAGRFYLQVGYDDYFDIGQSGWSGAKYMPSSQIIKKVDDSLTFVDNVGTVIKTINATSKTEQNVDMGDKLTNVVKYICELGKKEKIVTKKLWLEKIPDIIYLSNVKTKYSYKPIQYYINPVIGEYDNPSAQSQGILNLDLTHDGNTVIYGQSGSGKENLITTIIWSSIVEHTPDEVNIYVIDCGAETLKMFYKMPHVGAIANVDEQDKVYDILNLASNELEKRKELFSDYAGNYINYLENSGKKLPLMMFIINGYDNFSETYGNLCDQIQPLYRECSKYGIAFILSTSTPNSIGYRMIQNINNRISLQLSDSSDYRSLLDAPKGLYPANVFGRGIIRKDQCYEFQTASICDTKNLNNTIKNAADVLNKSYKTSAPKIKTIPQQVTISSLDLNGISIKKMPLGIDIHTKGTSYYDFTKNKINFILSEVMSDKMPFIYAFIKILSSISSLKVRVVDVIGAIEKHLDNVTIINSDFDNTIVNMNNELVGTQSGELTNVCIIISPSNMNTKFSEKAKAVLNHLLENANTLSNTIFIVIDEYNNSKQLRVETWYQTQFNNSCGIWLGTGLDSQMAININNMSSEERKTNVPYMMYEFNSGQQVPVKSVLDVESNEVDNEK